MPEDVARSLAAGMNGHLAKPVRPEQLEAALARLAGHPAGPGWPKALTCCWCPFGDKRPQPAGAPRLAGFPSARPCRRSTMLAHRSFALMVVAGDVDLAMARELARSSGLRLALWWRARTGRHQLRARSGWRRRRRMRFWRRRCFSSRTGEPCACGLRQPVRSGQARDAARIVRERAVDQHAALRQCTAGDEARAIAHRISGSAANMGEVDLADRARAVMVADPESFKPAMAELLAALAARLEAGQDTMVRTQ